MVDIYSQGHVVTHDDGYLEMNWVTQEVSIRSPLKLPVICKDELRIEMTTRNNYKALVYIQV